MADGKVTDATRLERVAPGLNALAARGAKVIVMSHYGRPKTRDPKYSLAPIARELSGVLGRAVHFVDDCIGEAAEAAVAGLAFGDVRFSRISASTRAKRRTTPSSPRR